MSDICRIVAAGIVILLTGSAIQIGANAADLEGGTRVRNATQVVDRSCQRVWKCGRAGCEWKHVCARTCPDGYSCYTLYGAYGPYGGVSYWARYTYGGWGWR